MQRSHTRRAVIARGAALAGATTLVPLAAACGASTASDKAPAARAVAPANLTFMTFLVGSDAFGVSTEKSVAAFRQAFPTINVTVEPAPNAPVDAILTKFQAALAGGTAPDVALMRPQYMPMLHATSALQPVEAFLAREKDLNKDSFFKVALSRITFENKVYGIPWDFWTTALYYNRDMFEAAGVKTPDANWTWDTYLDAAKKLTSTSGAEKRHGSDRPIWRSHVWDNGGEILDAKGAAFTLDQAPAADAIQFVADLALKQQVVPSADELKEMSGQDRFLTGRLGMYMSGVFFQGTPASKASFKWDLAPQPKGKAGRRPETGGANFCMPTGIKTADAAWTFMKYMGGAEAAGIRGREAGLFPALPAAAKPELIKNFTAAHIKAIVDAVGDARHVPAVPKWTEVEPKINQALNPVWTGETSAKEAMTKLAPQINGILTSR